MITLCLVQDDSILEGLRALDRARGAASRSLQIGEWRFDVHGLDPPLASSLDRRWGGFVVPASSGPSRVTLRIFRGSSRAWLARAEGGETYRVLGRQEEGGAVAYSYHFALAPDREPGAYRCALTDQGEEPDERVLENAIRCLLLRVAVEEGGFALHAAGVLDGASAYIFAGPSRAGKTTAVALSSPRPSLGDDFAVLVRRREGWCAPAVPFDNTEIAPAAPPSGLFPVAGIWRLFQAEVPRVEKVPPTRAMASLMACAALPWTLPDLTERLLEQIRRFVAESRFEHLHFRRAPDFWPVLRTPA